MWTILIPFLQPLFSQLLARLCPQPASGQRKDPQVELMAHLAPGGQSFKPESLANARKTTLRGVKMNNRHVGKRSADYIKLPRRREELHATLDEATSNYWMSVIKAPKAHVMGAFKAGVNAALPPEGDDD